MGTLITIAQFILALAILVTLHEFGHFIAARAFGIKVEKFYLFFDAFGIKLFKFKKGDTEYGIGWLPLGGYVKIAGMIDESMDTKQMATAPEPWEFRSKPAWQRLIVMIGGVTVNLILGIGIVVTMLMINGDSFIPNKAINAKGGIYAGPIARKLGFQTGDKIISFNGKPVLDLDGDFNADFILGSKKEVAINRAGKDTVINLPKNFEEYFSKKSDLPFWDAPYTYKIQKVVGGSNASKAGIKEGDIIAEINGKDSRIFYALKELLLENKGKEVTATVVTAKDGIKPMKVMVDADGTIGFQPAFTGFDDETIKIHYGLGQSIVKGTNRSFNLLGANVKALGKVFSGQVNAKKTVAGPIGIAQMFGNKWNWMNFWALTAMLSLVLALMNILPIPALDGGHVMFLLYEMITGRPVNEKVLYAGQIIGMVLLGALFIFIFWVDISRALGF